LTFFFFFFLKEKIKHRKKKAKTIKREGDTAMKLKDEDKANEKYFVSVVHYMKAIKLMEV